MGALEQPKTGPGKHLQHYMVAQSSGQERRRSKTPADSFKMPVNMICVCFSLTLAVHTPVKPAQVPFLVFFPSPPWMRRSKQIKGFSDF